MKRLEFDPPNEQHENIFRNVRFRRDFQLNAICTVIKQLILPMCVYKQSKIRISFSSQLSPFLFHNLSTLPPPPQRFRNSHDLKKVKGPALKSGEKPSSPAIGEFSSWSNLAMNREVFVCVFLFILIIAVTAHESLLDCFDQWGKIKCVLPQNCRGNFLPEKGCPRNQICCTMANQNLPLRRHSQRPQGVQWPRDFGSFPLKFGVKPTRFVVRNVHLPKKDTMLANQPLKGDKKEQFHVYNVKAEDEKKENPDIVFIDPENNLPDYEDFDNESGIQGRNIESRDTKSKPGNKSKAYCRKYTKWSMNTSNVMPLLPDYMSSTIQKEDCPPKFQPLIVGGMNATIKDFPHMAALGYRKNDEIDYLCGGTIISEYFVLTAAHCSKTRWGPPVVVNVGSTELYSNGLEIPIGSIIPHPNYKTPSCYDDIALLRLAKKIKFSNNLRPACLATIESKAQSPGKVAVATGWGKTGFGRESSNYLLKVRLKLITNNECNEFYSADKKTQSLKHGITSNMICATGNEDVIQDTCQGDSGGPLQARLPENDCMIQVIGVTSFGKACGTGIPGVYTKIAPYLGWIESVVWP